MESERKQVVITGISGFLGSHVCKVFLETGRYRVRGTVRDRNNEKKIAPLRKAFGDHFNELELVEADLMDAQSLDKAIEGMDYVIHTASPFPSETPKDENEIITPAVEGTMGVLRAAHKYKVKRVVITSSVASIMFQTQETSKDIYTEADWSNLKGCEPYEKSKTLAEQAAWEYLKGLPEHERFELVTINPSLIFGPSLISSDFTSGLVIQKIMAEKFPGVPKIMFPIVDVRNVAYAHLRGLEVEEANGNRFILSGKGVWFFEIAAALKSEFGKYYKIRDRELAYCTVKIAALFDKSVQMLIPMWGRKLNLDNKKSKEVLGIEYIYPQKSIIDMAQSMIDAGIIKNKIKD
ncbi:nad dependent epimerase dehydratase [Stylonychia lemnae]|uniref:Nad dependent epimerase dehydratase n=1 Tax=Stylonychia lemnae TaxID=5949 RepID=A0A078A3M7_STYLE|nr:nad dependent epimerase dehydratase [Stylonychia lemnae]|eukprot:CDW76422.1 nad dependent epimerase dehydratase [Stylonychia lemnae]